MYKNVISFLRDLMKHEGYIFKDSYGRMWMYYSYQFYYKSLSVEESWKEGTFCLHLHSTRIENTRVTGYREI